MKEITFSLIEIFISLIVETIILGGLFTWISNKTSQNMQQKLTDEMNNIETQNKFIYQQLKEEMRMNRKDIISQVKESAQQKGGN
jgi:adenine-specific DNA methylase